MAGLRSQNGLGQNGFSYVKKSMPASLSPGNPLPYLLTKWLRRECEGKQEIQKTGILVDVPWEKEEPFAVMSLQEMELP